MKLKTKRLNGRDHLPPPPTYTDHLPPPNLDPAMCTGAEAPSSLAQAH